MKTLYFFRNSEMTAFALEHPALDLYRVRLECECKTRNRRDGILLIDNNKVVFKLVRCRACKKIEV